MKNPPNIEKSGKVRSYQSLGILQTIPLNSKYPGKQIP